MTLISQQFILFFSHGNYFFSLVTANRVENNHPLTELLSNTDIFECFIPLSTKFLTLSFADCEHFRYPIKFAIFITTAAITTGR